MNIIRASRLSLLSAQTSKPQPAGCSSSQPLSCPDGSVALEAIFPASSKEVAPNGMRGPLDSQLVALRMPGQQMCFKWLLCARSRAGRETGPYPGGEEREFHIEGKPGTGQNQGGLERYACC